MEEYLQYMRTLRTQMNEVEDQAAKISVEEQMHLTTIRNLEKDLDFVKNEIKHVMEEMDRIMKATGLIRFQILEKQRKIASLELDSSTLSQGLLVLLITKLHRQEIKSARKLVKLKMMQMKYNLVLENSKQELQEMDTQLLDEELQALLSDKAGEA